MHDRLLAEARRIAGGADAIVGRHARKARLPDRACRRRPPAVHLIVIALHAQILIALERILLLPELRP